MTSSDIPDGYVAVARILGAWGVRGEVKAEAMAPEAVLARGREVTIAGRQSSLERIARSATHLRLLLAGIDSREAAASLRDQFVLVTEDSLPPMPEGEYYRFQLLGMRVVSIEGESLGAIEDIFSTPENDVYVVRGDGRDILVPAVEDVVQQIDLDGAHHDD